MSLKQYQTPDVFEVGLDEAGRGCLFGPVCIAGVSWLDKDPEGCIEIKDSKKYIFPKKCPSCGSKAIKEFNSVTQKFDAVKRCSSEGFKCERIAIERIKHFVSKEALNVEGLGKKVVEKFWDLNLIRFPQDIFKLNFEIIEKLDGWGK